MGRTAGSRVSVRRVGELALQKVKDPVPLRSLTDRIPEDRLLVQAWHPWPPFGWERPGVNGKSKPPTLYTKARHRDRQGSVRECLREAGAVRPYVAGMVVVELLFSMPGRAKGAHYDIDNLAKLVMDAANGLVYGDDRQVSDLHVRRIVAPQPESVGSLLVFGRV